MKEMLYTNPGAFCIVNGEDGTLMSYAQGLEIFKDSQGVYAEWFDKTLFYSRSIGIDSFDKQEKDIVVRASGQSLHFTFIDRNFYTKIKENGWLRKDLIKDFTSDQEVQDYFATLSAYS